MKKRIILPALLTALALTACGANTTTTPPTTSAAAAWAPAGMTAYGAGLAWEWTPQTQVTCKTYQDGSCYGVTVATQFGCSDGVYVELSIIDSSGASVGRANDITAGLTTGGKAKVALDMPGGAPKGAKARLSKLNCLGG